jgi:hypothetical protein
VLAPCILSIAFLSVSPSPILSPKIFFHA